MKRYYFIFLLFFVLAIAGCGGGGGSSSDDNGGGGGTGDTAGLCFTSSRSTVVSIKINGTLDNIPALEYSKDGLNWSPIALVNGSTAEVTDLSDGEKVYLRARNSNNSFSKDELNNIQFIFAGDGSIAASGNIMSLLNKNCSGNSVQDYAFVSLFSGCTSLTAAPDLPATTLAVCCYYSMFKGCTSLTTAPDLPATTLAFSCYGNMFYGCTSLTTASDLPATSLAGCCYLGMFGGCTNLTTAPDLPATTLAVSCYGSMFYGCKSLTTAPDLPATSLVSGCYGNMFGGCTNLTTAPDLPATSLAFNCYRLMFSGCSNLNYIKVYFTDWAEGIHATENWVYEVTNLVGTFYHKAGLDVSTKNGSHVPEHFIPETF